MLVDIIVALFKLFLNLVIESTFFTDGDFEVEICFINKNRSCSFMIRKVI